MHKCPIRSCERQLPHARLMCWPHWRLVPAMLKQAVYDAYHRFGVGTVQHGQAVVAAVAAVEERLKVRSGGAGG